MPTVTAYRALLCVRTVTTVREMDALEMEDNLPAPMPSARAVDAGLTQRVARGLGGVLEARQIEVLMAWMQRYERALAWVAVHGDRDSAMLARLVLAGGWDDAWGLDYTHGSCIVEGMDSTVQSTPAGGE